MSIVVRRAYDAATADDGLRVLVDRLWPRGVSRERARLDDWAKDLAPSTELREWFGHDPARFAEFGERYLHELDSPSAENAAERLRALAAGRDVTLITATKDLEHGHAGILAEWLGSRL